MSRYWMEGGRPHCRHGVILHGTKCLTCEREPEQPIQTVNVPPIGETPNWRGNWHGKTAWTIDDPMSFDPPLGMEEARATRWYHRPDPRVRPTHYKAWDFGGDMGTVHIYNPVNLACDRCGLTAREVHDHGMRECRPEHRDRVHNGPGISDAMSYAFEAMKRDARWFGYGVCEIITDPKDTRGMDAKRVGA